MSETAPRSFARSSYLAASIFALGFVVIAAGYVGSYVQLKTYQAEAVSADARYDALKSLMDRERLARINKISVPEPVKPPPVVPVPVVPTPEQPVTPTPPPSDFLTETGRLLAKYGGGTLDKSVNWADLQHAVEAMPLGKRRQAVLSAILLTWRSAGAVPNPESPRPGYGIDGIVAEELSIAGVLQPPESGGTPDEPRLIKLTQGLKQTADPQAGDVALYSGAAGAFFIVVLAVDESKKLTCVVASQGGTRAMLFRANPPLRIESIGPGVKEGSGLAYYQVPYPD